MKNVRRKYIFESLVDILRQQQFSLIIDESTGLSSTKHLAVCIRYQCKTDFTVCDKFLTLLEVSTGIIEC